MPGSIVAGDGGSAEPTSGPSGGTGTSAGTGIGGAGSAGQPTPISLTHESLIQAPGLDKPVKYSDFINGYVPKADFTRAQQRVAAERDALKKQMETERTQFRTAAQQILSRMQGGGQGNAAPEPGSMQATLAQLEAAPYVDGQTAANLVRNLIQTNVMPLAEAIKQRDQALAIMFQRLQALGGTVGTLQSRTTEGDFHGKLSAARASLGLPDDPVIGELLQDVYLSHEGEDLDQEFPNIVRQRIEALRLLFRNLDKKEAEDSRANRLGIPGKGGAAAPGRPLRRGFQSPQQIADELWPGGTPET